jgi:hypothetical protein
VARPLSVLVSSVVQPMGPRDLAFLSWAGLRGAVPILLATIPLAEGVAGAEDLFDIVFVMVVVYTLLTGPTLPWVAGLLGVARRSEPRGLEVEVAPLDRVAADLTVFAGGLTNDLDGATSQQLSMSDLAFHALREYVPGDDLRHVHWRSSAKAGELLVRQYHETRRGHVTVLVDGSASSYRRLRDFELAVSVGASIALRSVRDDFDTYFRCGPHIARGRSAAAMTDAACRFVPTRNDDYLVQSADAAAAVVGTGLVVQVTGARRELVDLDAAARRFDLGADWLVVRADSEVEARLADTARFRELSVPQLSDLRDLFARGLR